METSLSGSSKRPKAPNNAIQAVNCLVDGCSADLSQCREYHRRHKVCEAHSKTPRVTIRGREQRFCQQCSRFHSLVEFDEGKRSCRKRLDGHNRRRRKPQPDSLSRNAGVLPSHQGTRLVSFSGQQILSSAAVSSSWAGIVKAESDFALYDTVAPLNYLNKPASFTESSSQSYKGISQFEFMQGTSHALSEGPFCQQLLDPNSASGNCASSQSLFSNGLDQAVNSDHARSLLSPPPAIVRENILSHALQSEFVPQGQPLINSMHCCTLAQNPFTHETVSAPVVSPTYSNANNSATIHFQGMFQDEPDGSSASGSHQMLTFRWE